MERYNQRLLIKFEIFQRIDGDDEIDSDYNKETNEEPRRRRSHGGQREMRAFLLPGFSSFKGKRRIAKSTIFAINLRKLFFYWPITRRHIAAC